MNLKHLLKGQVFQASQPLADEEITGISLNSETVEPGHLFIATTPLGKTDITSHITTALSKGARFVLKDRDIPMPDGHTSQAIVLNVINARMARARIAANLFPGQPEKVVLVTGTNGKTSVSHFLKQIWENLGEQAACMGTAGLYGTGSMDLDDLQTSALTSPDSFSLHQILSSLKERGCTHLALEASSHGLDQRRMDYVDLTAAGYTNLSHEHLDYHQDMTTYFEAKTRLFTEILPEGCGAVLNADDFRFPALAAKCRERGQRLITFGRESHDIKLLNVDLDENGQLLDLSVFGRHYKIHLPLIGTIQSYNVMCAIGLAIATGTHEEDVLKVIPLLQSVPGRFEWVGTLENGAKVYVDYAHTPDALSTLLTSLRPHVKGLIHLVFGCGGDRDKLKRPMMGELADKLAERVYVTDDNPRTENPSKIRAEIRATCPESKDIPDRRQAIATALAKCKAHDICVIAGKGHEQGQIMGSDVLPFDDRVVARQEISTLKGAPR